MANIFGYDSFTDMFDGGGKGGSGDQFYSGTNEDYVNAGGTNTGGDDNSFFDRVINTSKNDNNLTYNTPDASTSSNGSSSSGGSSSPSSAESSGPDGLTAESILEMAKNAGVVTSNEEIQALIDDPEGFLKDRNMSIQDFLTLIKADAAGTNLDPSDPKYALEGDGGYDAETVDTTATVEDPGKGTASFYTANTVTDKMGGPSTTVEAATGTVTDDMLVDPNDVQIDMDATAKGINAVGEALKDFATIDTSMIIDTSTLTGKLLAQKLGEGGYTDAKATILGQAKIISEEFKDGNGNPKIPTWAQGLSREVSRMMAFGGVTGTAAVATMSNALMEATLGIAEKEASFFQTLTIKNLDNRQQAAINRANVLAQFEVANLDARQAALVNNAKAFLQMDLTNLSNKQQAEVVNTQAMVQALFTDQAAINAQRLFSAETQNDFEKFYDQLSATVQQFNATQVNSMNQFNTSETNTAARFNADMENQRQQFYANMQYNIDLANAKWRQSVEMENTRLLYEALSTDVKNMLDISTEGQNQLWDRVDSMFDYIWKSAEGELGREAQIIAAEIAAQSKGSSGSSGIWSAIGQIGAAFITKSDQRLKDNIEHFDTLPSGIDMYTWTWNEEAKRIGADKYPPIGVIAQEIQKTHPEAVVTGDHGYLMVNYGKIQ